MLLIHFYKFGHKCVLAVCEHNHPTMMKIYPLLIFNPLKTKSVSLGLLFWFSCSVTSHCIGPGHRVWLTALHCYSFHLQWLYAVLIFFRARVAAMSTMSRKQSRCSVFRCKTEHKSLHLVPTSELLRMLWIPFHFSRQCASKYVYHSRLLCECNLIIVHSVSTAFLCIY